KAISAQKPKSGKKTISEAFNLADVLISASGSSNRGRARVVVLSDTVSDDCLSEKHDIDAFKIASRNTVDRSVYQTVAKWVCTGQSMGGSPVRPGGGGTTSSSSYMTQGSSDSGTTQSSSDSGTTQSSSDSGTTQSSSDSGTTQSSSDSGTTQSSSDSGTTQSSSDSGTTQSSSSTSTTTTSTTSSTSGSTSNKDIMAQIPYVPGSGSDVALLIIIDFTKSSEKLFNAYRTKYHCQLRTAPPPNREEL
ncbi:hypothetical protein OSTOST_06459, partial [Ostertagia ostertagi]